MTFLMTGMLTHSEETEDFGACWLVKLISAHRPGSVCSICQGTR